MTPGPLQTQFFPARYARGGALRASALRAEGRPYHGPYVSSLTTIPARNGKTNVNYRLTRHARLAGADMLTWLAHKTTVAAAQPRAFSSSLACSMRKVKNCRCLPCLASYTRCSWKQTCVYCSRSTLVLNLMSCKKSASHLEI